MATLYSLTNDYMRLLQLAEDADADEQALADTMEGLEGELELKAEAYAKIIRQLEADADAYMHEANQFIKKADVCSKNAARMKEALKKAMTLTGLSSLDAGLFKMKIVRNGGKRPLVIKGDVPKRFRIMVEQNDTDAIRKYLESLPDETVCDWAHLEERGNHITIR